jgi:hypothetical protein
VSRNASTVSRAVEEFVRASIMVREKREPTADEVREVLSQLLDNVQANRQATDPFAWDDAARLLDEVATWHLR